MFMHNWQDSLQLHEDFNNGCIKQAQIIVPSRGAACHAPKPSLHTFMKAWVVHRVYKPVQQNTCLKDKMGEKALSS